MTPRVQATGAVGTLAAALRDPAVPQPWLVVCRDVFDWPFGAPSEPASPARSTWFRKLIEWLFRWLRRPTPVAPVPVVDETLVRGAHAELAADNLAHAVAWSAPLWYDLPLAPGISEAGLLAVTDARNATRRRPSTGAVEAETEKKRARPAVGDPLALHLAVEARAKKLAADLEPARRDARRRLGGLRTETFLTVYPALCRQHGEQRASELTHAAESPLSQWIYLDLLAPQPSAAPPPLALPRLGPTSGALWLPLLARSLVAACLSPDRTVDELVEARTQVAAEVARSHARVPQGAWNSDFWTHEGPALRAAREHETATLDACRRRFAERWIATSGLCARSEMLRLRFLDLLVRQLAVCNRQAMLDQWQRRPRRSPPARRRLLLPPSGACFRAFRRVLVGADWTDEEDWCPDQPGGPPLRRLLRTATERLLRLPDRDDLEDPSRVRALADDAGVEETEAAALVARLWRRPVPIPVPDRVGYPPASLITDWAVAIRNELDTGQNDGDTT